MSMKYLAIEGDDLIHETESRFWLSKGISSVKVSSMSEGIELASTEQFLFIGINSDNINYKPKLPFLRDVTNDPIFIATSRYTKEEHAEAHSLGADLFGEVFENPQGNYEAIMTKISQINGRSSQRKHTPEMIYSNNIHISRTRHQVFYGEKKIELTKIDFDVLYYLMENRGCVLSFDQIYNYAWDDRDNESVINPVKCAVKRLRKKITGCDCDNDIIENIRGVGYRFPL